MTATVVPAPPVGWRRWLALFTANVALALGPWSVRLSDSGPVSAGFWRLLLPLPLLFAFARAARQPVLGLDRRAVVAIAAAGLIFAIDLGAWHLGIGLTRLGNSTLFANSGSLIVMVWGFIAVRRTPTRFEWTALASALAGATILFGRSLQIGRATLAGDLLCLLAGFCYAFYIILLQDARARFGNWALLAWTCVAGLLPLLAFALWLGEPVWPHRWWPLVTLALGSQVIGQGLLVYSLRHFQPLVIGLALLTQPVVAILAGWFAFGEVLGEWDALGMTLVAGALVIARAGERT